MTTYNQESSPFQGFTSQNLPQGASFNSGSKRTTTITAKDLAFAIDISPSMLVENPINVEKLMSILMEESDDDADEDMDGQDDMESDSAVFEV